MPNDHFVPACYLRGFSIDYPDNLSYPREKVLINAYDILKDRLFTTNINNVCCSHDFYSLFDEQGNEDRSIESYFGKIEESYSNISHSYYKHYIVHKNYFDVPFSVENERIFMTNYLLYQMKRTPQFYERIKVEIGDDLHGLNEQEMKTALNIIMFNLGNKPINDGVKTGHEYLNAKYWTIFIIADKKDRFLTSDAPVVLFENNGIALDETEISFPINEFIVLHLHKIPSFKPVEIISSNSRINHQFVREMNVKRIFNATRFIFGSDEEMLMSCVNEYKEVMSGININKYFNKQKCAPK